MNGLMTQTQHDLNIEKHIYIYTHGAKYSHNIKKTCLCRLFFKPDASICSQLCNSVIAGALHSIRMHECIHPHLKWAHFNIIFKNNFCIITHHSLLYSSLSHAWMHTHTIIHKTCHTWSPTPVHFCVYMILSIFHPHPKPFSIHTQWHNNSRTIMQTWHKCSSDSENGSLFLSTIQRWSQINHRNFGVAIDRRHCRK